MEEDAPPSFTEFMLRGYSLSETKDAREVWAMLSLEERAALGFGPDGENDKLKRVRALAARVARQGG